MATLKDIASTILLEIRELYSGEKEDLLKVIQKFGCPETAVIEENIYRGN